MSLHQRGRLDKTGCPALLREEIEDNSQTTVNTPFPIPRLFLRTHSVTPEKPGRHANDGRAAAQ